MSGQRFLWVIRCPNDKIANATYFNVQNSKQRTNAVMLAEDLKVSLRPKICENGIIGRLEIAKVVKGLMEDEEGNGVRVRIESALKDAKMGRKFDSPLRISSSGAHTCGKAWALKAARHVAKWVRSPPSLVDGACGGVNLVALIRWTQADTDHVCTSRDLPSGGVLKDRSPSSPGRPSRGNQGKGTSSSHLIPTHDDFVDTQHFPTIPLDLEQELFSGTQEDFNLDDELDDIPTNVDDNTPTSTPSTEIPPIPSSMRRGPTKRPLKSYAWTFFDRDVENQVAICKICKNVLKFKTRKRSRWNGGLIRHVVSAHPLGMPNTRLQNRVRKRPLYRDKVHIPIHRPDQVRGQINPMMGGIVGSKYNKHRDREAISKLVACEENASNLPASIPSSSSSTQPHKRHVKFRASIESLGFVPYQEVINEDGHEDLFEILEGNEKTFPTLSLMARDVLNIQASSIASESAFSRRRISNRRPRHSLAETLGNCVLFVEIGYERSERRCGQPEINEEDDKNYNEILTEGSGSDVDQFDQQIPIPTEEPQKSSSN
ncbi:hypothetical protein RND71_035141 [Anisodus tanguticus]|uniref:BED-type domain-containing protein n=1 Tax=Anisodus tanguticus TaxID=243964 RepID=A0AAE1V1X5_9SOLA|nr:hypothetical protein RND71_035141 [Anisodus tanguticus]